MWPLRGLSTGEYVKGLSYRLTDSTDDGAYDFGRWTLPGATALLSATMGSARLSALANSPPRSMEWARVGSSEGGLISRSFLSMAGSSRLNDLPMRGVVGTVLATGGLAVRVKKLPILMER